MKVVSTELCIQLLVLLSLVWGEAVVAINRPGINPFPDVSVGQSIALRPLADGVFVETSPGVKPGDLVACMRVRIHGILRISNVQKFAVVTRVKVQSEPAPAYRPAPPKVEVCMHRNGSMEVAQCSKESWRTLEQGFWSKSMSPFETKYVDLRLTVSHTDVVLNISVEEEVQGFRIAFLVLGILLVLLAPSVSDWLPFYYSSAMTLGVFLVLIVLLYQGMKLLPTGRNNSLFIVLYGLLLGMGSVVLHYFSALVSTLLKELGLGDDMHNPMAVFLGLGVVLIGAWVGLWGVRKMVLAEDGNIDSGVAKFVKWAIRIIGGAMLLQSSCDVIFSGLTLAFGLAATWVVGKFFNLLGNLGVGEALEHQWSERPTMRIQNASTKLGVNRSPLTKMQANPLQNLPEKDALTRWEQVNALLRRNLTEPRANMTTPSPLRGKECYSTFHKTPDRKPLSSSDYKATDITGEAVSELVESKEFQEWWATKVVSKNRIIIAPIEHREERPEKDIEVTASFPENEFFLSKNSDHSRKYLGKT